MISGKYITIFFISIFKYNLLLPIKIIKIRLYRIKLNNITYKFYNTFVTQYKMYFRQF